MYEKNINLFAYSHFTKNLRCFERCVSTDNCPFRIWCEKKNYEI